MVSIATAADAAYPPSTWCFSPSEAYPEYALGHLAPEPNRAYGLVREALHHAGLDAAHFGSPAWNPLGDLVRPGASVFLLCNFVYHRRPSESETDFQSKCTHGSVLRAIADYALKAVGPAGRVHFGNAPLQSCDWDRVMAETGAAVVAAFYRERGLPVAPVDLRLRVAHRDALGRVRTTELREDDAAVTIDLGEESLLREIDDPARPSRFRVSDYDPARTQAFHHAGAHRYVLHHEVIDADLVLSVPKLKTHEKVGITVALKGFVGAVGHKDCLAHHRFGSPARGGDEYPDRFAFLVPAPGFHEWVHGHRRGAGLQGALEVADRLGRTALRRMGATIAGAWSGNETCWRMALDLARIVHFADRDGVMHEEPQRRHAVLVDGIVGGEGDGPLAPRAFPSRLVAFSDSVVAADLACAALMGFDAQRIPLLAHARNLSSWPLVDGADRAPALLDGRPVDASALAAVLPRRFAPPAGWRGRLGSP